MIGWRGYLQVGVGSGLGALSRALVGQAAILALGSAFIWATLAVNVLGSWLIAVVASRAAYRPHGISARWYPLVAVGFCGGFTTFSMFGLEVIYLLSTEQTLYAIVYVFSSVVLWLAAAWLGQLSGRPTKP
ncbi:fluoride efflux transporter FluC [Halomonas halocynthiae]|uniref:fluoride efflux transporter FluC n=1 Tax=Halomonas halocynthiae TaxID=176290 RepID=UPI00040A4638|nr:CrcB family protein [Halomonas halocynthiae]